MFHSFCFSLFSLRKFLVDSVTFFVRMFLLISIYIFLNIVYGESNTTTILKYDASQLFAISATPSQTTIKNNVTQNISILFEIDSMKSKDGDDDNSRQPNELAIVLDTSGSMYGDRIKYAKSAIKQIISDLIIGDILHIIIYNDDGNVLFKDGDISTIPYMLRQIDEIEAVGSTNMYGGLRKAYNILKKNGKKRIKEQGKIGMKQRVFLFSDGWVNAGDVQDDDAILNKIDKKKIKYGITTSSIGVGDNFNRPLLNNMSIVGEGDFFYIDSANSIEFVVNIAKKSYQSTIATRTKLLLFGIDQTKYQINDLYARGDIEANTAIIDINDLRADDKKYIVIGMQINTNNNNETESKTVEILRWKLKYQIMKDGQEIKQAIENKVKLEIVDDDDDMEIIKNADVCMHTVLSSSRVEDIFIFEEETINGNLDTAVTRKTNLIESIESEYDLYKKSNNVNEDTLRLIEIELRRHKTTLDSLKVAKHTKSKKERYKATLKQHSDIVRNVNASFFHDEL